MEETLPASVKVCSYEIQVVERPMKPNYIELNLVLREVKDPRVIVLAHPTFGFPSLPNLVGLERHRGNHSQRSRNQLEDCEEVEHFAWSHVRGLEAAESRGV